MSAHPDLRVLAALMAAEGLGDAVRYTRAEDGALETWTYSGGAGDEPRALAPVCAAGPDAAPDGGAA